MLQIIDERYKAFLQLRGIPHGQTSCNTKYCYGSLPLRGGWGDAGHGGHPGWL